MYGYCGDYKALGRGKPVWNIEYCDEWSVSAMLCRAVPCCKQAQERQPPAAKGTAGYRTSCLGHS